MPLVSVVMIFFNAERFIEEAVQSVLDQDFKDWELVLADDGSADRSTEIALHFAANDSRVRYVEHPGHVNKGMSATRNLGAANATGKYLAFLDSDDVWAPTKLTEQVALLEQMPNVGMVSGAVLHWFDWDPKSTQANRIARPGGYSNRYFKSPEAALALNPLTRGTDAIAEVLVRRSVFDNVGGFEERFRGLYEDQAFYVKVYLRHDIFISDACWLQYRMHDDSCCGQLRNSNRVLTWQRRAAFFAWLHELDKANWFSDRRVSKKLRRRRVELRLALWASPAVTLADRIREWRNRASKRMPAQTLGAPGSTASPTTQDVVPHV